MLTYLLVTLSAAGAVLCSPMANQYVDSVLNTAFRNEIRSLRLDPATLPDFSTEFVDKVPIFGKVKGQANYTHGKLTGLSQAYRFSECHGPSYSFGSKFVNCTITFDHLKMEYDGKLKYGKVPKVNIKGQANVTTTLVFIDVAQNPPMPPTVRNFLFQQIGLLHLKITGLGPLNKYTKFLEDGYKSHVQAEVFNTMSQSVRYALNRAVALIPLPN